DLCAVVVLLICIQQAFGAEGISQLFQGSTGVFDPLKIQPFPGAMSGSDQVLLSEPAIDGVAVFVSEQSIQSPPVDCSRRRAAFHWSFDMDLVRCRQASQKGLGDYQVDADLAAAVAQLGWVVRLDVVAVSNQFAGAFMDFKQGFLTVR